jgi:sporulation protein YlmC with PRC-barrel domain
MVKTLAYATLFSTALAGSVAIAQTSGGADNPTAPMKQEQTQSDKMSTQGAQPGKDQAAATAPEAPTGVTFVRTQDVKQWRAPKLIGVGVFGSDDKQIGKIDDVLMSHDGKAETVVIGIGGFLGFGKKDVAVPFTAVQWRTEPRKMAATDQPPAPPTTAPLTGTGGQEATKPAMKETDPAATEANQGYPDKAILGVTLAELKSAPDFQYAPSPLAEASDSQSKASQPARTTTP